MYVTGDAASLAATSATSEEMAANKSQNTKSKLLPTVDIQDCSSHNASVVLEVEEFEDELADLTSKNVMKSPTILTPPQCTPRSTSPISKSPASRSPARSPVRSPTSSKNSHSSGHAPQKQFLQGMCLNSAQYFHNFFKLFPSLILKSCNSLKPFQLFEKENGFLSPT